MSKKSDQVKSGYAELSVAERNEVKQWINQFDASSELSQRSLKESVETFSEKRSGPRDSSACACCGR